MFGNRILILIPHPDDEVVGCFAAARRAVARGATLFGLYLTTGVPAAEQLWPWDRKSHASRVHVRRKEAERAAELLSMEILGFRETPTRAFRHDLDTVRGDVLAILAERKIDSIWVPAFEGAHQDHDAANAMAHTLRSQVEVFEYAEYNNADGRAKSNHFPKPNGTEKRLQLSVEEAEAKRAALAVYDSEQGNLAHIDAQRETFRPLAEYDYAQPPHPGKLFFARFQWVPIPHPRVDFTPPAEVYAALGDFVRRQGSG